MDAQTLAMLIAVITALGAIATSIVTVMRSRSSVANEVISNYKVLDDQNKKSLEEWKQRTLKCEDLHRDGIAKMGEMKGQLESTLTILKDRNPETVEFMKYVVQVAKKSEEFMTASAAREDLVLSGLKEIGIFMASINNERKAAASHEQ